MVDFDIDHEWTLIIYYNGQSGLPGTSVKSIAYRLVKYKQYRVLKYRVHARLFRVEGKKIWRKILDKNSKAFNFLKDNDHPLAGPFSWSASPKILKFSVQILNPSKLRMTVVVDYFIDQYDFEQ